MFFLVLLLGSCHAHLVRRALEISANILIPNVVVGLSLSHVKLFFFPYKAAENSASIRVWKDFHPLFQFLVFISAERPDCRVTTEAKSQDAGLDKHGILCSLMERSLFWEAIDLCQTSYSISNSRSVGISDKISSAPVSKTHFFCLGYLGQEDDDHSNYSQQQRAESSTHKRPSPRLISCMFNNGRTMHAQFEMQVSAVTEGERHLEEFA